MLYDKIYIKQGRKNVEEKPEISQDDLLDVMEMTQTLEFLISDTLRGNQQSLAISALISASLNSLFSQARTMDDVKYYRDLFVDVMDEQVKKIKIDSANH
jgi:hypothetical protein